MIRLGLGSVMAVSAAPVAAESFDDACEPFPDGQTTVVEYHFSGDHWDLADSTGVAFEDQVRAALTQWESIRNLDGVPIVDIQETESDGVALVIQEFWDVKAEPDVPMDNLAGVSMVNDECEPQIGFNYFRMDGIEDPDPEDPNPADEFFSRPGLIGPVAGHELGHWMGLDHTGAFDSVYETKLPRMGMCYSLSTLYDLRDSEVSLDDSTAMLQRYGFPKPEAENFGGDWLSPNPGFEASTALAGWFGFNASYGIESTGNRHGSRHLRVEPSGSANVHKVYQWSSVAIGEQDGDPVVGEPVAGFAGLRSGSGTRVVDLRLFARDVSYTDDFPPNADGCSWPTGTYQNTRESVSALYQLTAVEALVGTEWSEAVVGYASVDNVSHSVGAFDLAFFVELDGPGGVVHVDDAGATVGGIWN